MLITCPLSRFTILGTTRRVMVKSPLILVSIIVSQSSKLPSYSGSKPRAKPALLIKTSICCHSSGRLLIAAVAALRFLTSKASANTLTPSASSSFFRLARSCALRPVMITSYPPCANLRAQASPIPLVAPVINTIFLIL